MHDIRLYFSKDGCYIPAHKVVVATADKLRTHIDAKQMGAPSSEITTLDFSAEYDSGIFAKVLKLLYLGTSKIIDVSILEARAMYRLACKIGAK